MYVHTTEAASRLGISPRRLRQLLQQGRIKGAYKSGKFWLIPLYNDLPQVIKAKGGQAGTWKTSKPPKKTIVHINSNNIKSNAKKSSQQRKPVIAIKTNVSQGGNGKNNIYVNQLEIPSPCRVVYQPDKPLPCGAKVWIEILDLDLELIQPPANIIDF